MKVLVDFHHADLFDSLKTLFEKRLGFEVYRPVGLDWYHKGYWKVFDALDTARQFLDLSIGGEWEEIRSRYPKAHFFSLNENAVELEPDLYVIPDITKDTVHRGITLDRFKDEEFGIIVSSIPLHIPVFNKLIEQYQPTAKHIFQVGNAWGSQPGVRNILASTAPFLVSRDINICFYHQEFDLNLFSYEPSNFLESNSINSYIHYMQRPDLFSQYSAAFPDFCFHSYGAGMQSNILKTADIAKTMKDSLLTWHFKPEGDGFGHIIHNTMAVGRPPLIFGSHYRNKLAENLLIDGITCLDLEKYSFAKNVSRIRDVLSSSQYLEMCSAAATKFREIVDYDTEEVKLRKFVGSLI